MNGWDAVWYGGPNYSLSDEREHVDTIAAAKRILQDRYDNRGRFTPGMDETPGVDETSEILLYAPGVDEYGRVADYPDYRVFFGPRMGVRVERV
jgi:hypothetical protein